MKRSGQATPRPGGRVDEDRTAQRVQVIERSAKGIVDEVGKVMVGKKEVLEFVMTAFLTDGAHVLFEDMPGLGKSVMASAFAHASGCDFRRIQFTPDLLPGDITGTSVYNQRDGQFTFHPGPVFTNILLADEINRASPKTQSALLEAMAEKQVSVEGVTHKVSKPFTVMATQNPVEQEGTYPLPEAQMDRFAMKLSVGYPNLGEEKEILRRRVARGQDEHEVANVSNAAKVAAMQKAVEEVHVSEEVHDYIARIVVATRHHEDLRAGASPRGSLALLKLARSSAAVHGKTYVTPDEVKRFAPHVLAHRVLLRPEAKLNDVTGHDVVHDILAKEPVPKV